MKFLDQFISQTGKQPTDWTSQDIQKYLDYVKAHKEQCQHDLITD
jgi:hypothetical protein